MPVTLAELRSLAALGRELATACAEIEALEAAAQFEARARVAAARRRLPGVPAVPAPALTFSEILNGDLKAIVFRDSPPISVRPVRSLRPSAQTVNQFGSTNLRLPQPTDKPFAPIVAAMLADPATFFRHVPPEALDEVKAKIKQVAGFTREQLDQAIEQVRTARVGPRQPNYRALLTLETILGEIAGIARGRPSVLAHSERRPGVRRFDDSGPPGPPPRPGLKWKRETQRWIRPDGSDEPGQQGGPSTAAAASTSKPGDRLPADHELATAAKTSLGGSGGVHKVSVRGRDYVMKEGRSARRYGNEVATSNLAAIAGVNMPRTHLATVRGLPVSVADFIPGGRTIDQIGRGMKDSAAMTAALAKVPKPDVDRAVLFDYLIGHTDAHNGNFMIDGNNRLHVIDRELTFDPRFGQSFRKPYFLDHLGGVGYRFDPATVRDMATAGRRMADHLKRSGDSKRAGVVEERLRVLESLARESAPTVGTLVALGNKGVAPHGAGFIRRAIWGLKHAAQLHSERRSTGTAPLANRTHRRA